jgi:hypothetical protein
MGSEIVGRQTSLLRDASEHARPNLLVIVKCKHDVWPAVATERPMRAGRPFDLPANPLEGCENPPGLRGWPATHAASNVTLRSSAGASRCSSRSAITRRAKACTLATA